MSNFKVIKKDGSIVEFKPEKIYEACISAGASEEIAQNVKEAVIEDLYKIKSEVIRQKTLNILKEFDKDVADNWIKYDIENARYEEEDYLKF